MQYIQGKIINLASVSADTALLRRLQAIHWLLAVIVWRHTANNQK